MRPNTNAWYQARSMSGGIAVYSNAISFISTMTSSVNRVCIFLQLNIWRLESGHEEDIGV
jgi:hypothetical protein